MPNDVRAIIHPTIIEQLINSLNMLNDDIRKWILDPEISNIINFGISSSSSKMDEEFINIYKEQLEHQIDKIKVDADILYNTSFSKEDHMEQLKTLLECFNERLQEDIEKALEFIDNK